VQDLSKKRAGLGLGAILPHANAMVRQRRRWFSTVSTWLPLADDTSNVNVEVECENRTPFSICNRRLIELRRGEPALAIGVCFRAN